MPPQSFDDPTPEQRRTEVAQLLATALLRYTRRVHIATPATVSESQENRLDVSRDIGIHASTRSAGERTGDPENQGEAGSHD